MSAAPPLAAEDDPTCSTSGTPQGVVYGTRRQASTSRNSQYSRKAVSSLLKSAISQAVPAILDRHGEYSELELSAYVRDAFPAIPQQLRGPVVLAATAAARHAALMHVVHSSNVDSPDQGKATFARGSERPLVLGPWVASSSSCAGITGTILLLFLFLLLLVRCDWSAMPSRPPAESI